VSLAPEVFSQEPGLGRFSTPLDAFQRNKETSRRPVAFHHDSNLKSSGRKTADPIPSD